MAKAQAIACTSYQGLISGIIHDMIFTYGSCVRWSFFEFWFFGLLGGSKGKKWQEDKKLCPLHFISQEPYIIWSWFMVHMCKRIISPGVFYIFSKFSGSIVGWKSKKWPKMTKNYVCCTPYLSKHTWFDHVFCCTSLKWWHLQMFFSFFQNFGFLGC